MPKVTITVVSIKKVSRITVRAAQGARILFRAARVRSAARHFISMARRINTAREALRRILDNLSEHCKGDEFDAYRDEHLRLCKAIDDMEECLRSCGNYMNTAVDEFEAAQKDAKKAAPQISSARG